MRARFQVQTYLPKMQVTRKGRQVVKEPCHLDVEMEINGNVVNLRYGYKSWTTEAVEDHTSVLAGQKYTLHNSIKPKQGDVWKCGGRTFEVGEPTGFVRYQAPLLENGIQVAIIKFEDYYKD